MTDVTMMDTTMTDATMMDATMTDTEPTQAQAADQHQDTGIAQVQVKEKADALTERREKWRTERFLMTKPDHQALASANRIPGEKLCYWCFKSGHLKAECELFVPPKVPQVNLRPAQIKRARAHQKRKAKHKDAKSRLQHAKRTGRLSREQLRKLEETDRERAEMKGEERTFAIRERT